MTKADGPGAAVARKDSQLPERVGTGSLFRPEVLGQRQSHWLGSVLLTPRLSHSVFALFSVAAIAALVSLLLFADYSRKARISGWLVPEQGLVRVFSPQAGVIAQLNVQEGDAVAAGTVLALLSTETESVAYGSIRQEIVLQLVSRIDSIMTEREQQEELFAYQTEDLRTRIATLEQELRQLDEELVVQRERVALAEAEAARQQEMRDRGLATMAPLMEAQQDSLDQKLRLQTLERERIVIDRERLRLEGELQQLPVKLAALLSGIEQRIAALEQELAEAESQRETVIVAPQDGTVTGIAVTSGSSVGATAPLLSIVPAGSELRAELFSPSSAIGFVRPGQQVLLRFDAFPYQRFGNYDGTVSGISRTAVSPTEFPQQLSWIATVHGTDEPLYRIAVALGEQEIRAYGERIPLQPGMRLEADVVIEHRQLIEWVLDPLYSLTGR